MTLAMAYRQDGSRPWMGLAAYAAPQGASNLDMLRGANLLGWNIRLREIVTDAKVDTKDFEVLRDDPSDGKVHRLSIAGERYRTVSNEELASMADGITSGDVKADAAGSWRNGRNVFMSFALGDDIVIDPKGSADKIARYLTIASSNDGSSSITAFIGDMRINCQNMLAGAKANALSIVRFRHTQSAEGRLLGARQALGVSFKQGAVFVDEMNELVKRDVDDAKFWKIVEALYPKPEKDVKGAVTKWETKRENIAGFWNGATVANLDKTAYRAYNALNENLMWGSGVRKGNPEGALVRASGFDELTNRKNAALYRSVLELTA